MQICCVSLYSMAGRGILSHYSEFSLRKSRPFWCKHPTLFSAGIPPFLVQANSFDATETPRKQASARKTAATIYYPLLSSPRQQCALSLRADHLVAPVSPACPLSFSHRSVLTRFNRLPSLPSTPPAYLFSSRLFFVMLISDSFLLSFESRSAFFAR
jgi:hypothetical protein